METHSIHPRCNGCAIVDVVVDDGVVVVIVGIQIGIIRIVNVGERDSGGLLMLRKEDSISLRSEEAISKDVIEVESGGSASSGDGSLCLG